MTPESDLARRRLRALRLAGPPLGGAEEVVRWLVAVQAQDLRSAVWSIGMRSGLDAAAVHRAIADGRLLRTHVLRPTWHLVGRDDLRWLLDLTGPSILARNAHRHRQLGLDDRTFARATEVIVRSLERGPHTRRDLREALEAAGIETGVERLAHLLMHAELTGTIAGGPPDGAQHTYALLPDEGPRPARDEALGELARRYLASHGPATAKDLRWWASLSAADATLGLERAETRPETIGGTTYWSTGRAPTAAPPDAQLVPGYDELLVGYTESRDVLARGGRSLRADGTGVALLRDRAAGRWKLHTVGEATTVELSPFEPLSSASQRALRRAADRYGGFLGRPVALRIVPDAV